MDAFVLRRARCPSTERLQGPGRWVLAIVAIAANCAFATEPMSAHRYELSGAGSISPDAPVQRGGGLHLKAILSPGEVAIEAPVLQSRGRFSLTATLAAQSSLVCYNDTIFRDDFDGDGF